jgi:glycosyltransferase involved in cell wall biosynthesis
LPSGSVVFSGYVRPEELAALLGACTALIFPSLYEGFGMPVLEAMASGKPVLCSRVTSLPEVADDVAIYFDPAEPAQIAAAIDALFQDDARIAGQVARGRARGKSFGDGRAMAERYLAEFDRVLAGVS